MALKRTLLRPGHQKAISLFTEKAKAMLKENLVDILVYGSVARGEATRSSDIDVIVIVEKETFSTQMRLAALAFDILMDTGQYISIQTMKSDDLKRDTMFLHNVRREAVHAM